MRLEDVWFIVDQKLVSVRFARPQLERFCAANHFDVKLLIRSWTSHTMLTQVCSS